MIVSIHQPNFLPWLGYFNKIYNSDTFIILDNVQFSKGSFTNRNKIKYTNGEGKWLTVPIDFAGSPSQNINDLKLSLREKFQRKHLEAIRSNYAKAPYFKEVFDLLKSVYEQDVVLLSDFNTALITMVLNYLNIDRKIVKASDLQKPGDILFKNDLLLDLLKRVDATIYLSGTGARSYNDEEMYKANNIEIRYNSFQHPEYPQLYGPFVSNMSVIDLLFNCGKESITFIKN